MSSQSQDELAISPDALLEEIKTWSSVALKTFLSLRNESTSGSHQLLISRALSAYERGIEADPEREHLERAILEEYKSKLNLEDEVIPDPIDLKNGWLNEANGIHTWPKLYFSDISRFYSSVLGKKDLIQRLETEYKQGKAYRYFTSSFIGEVHINNLGETSKFCILKTKCVPSQRVNMKQYDVWVISRKDTDDSVGGEILSAYCTCVAGLFGSCNHVAGLLFRVEAAVLTGVSDPTCTSKLAQWNIPTSKKTIKPDLVSNFLFNQETYLKKSISIDPETQKEKSNRKRNLRVMSPSQYANLQDHKAIREQFYEQTKDIIPFSCYTELMENKQKNVKRTIEPLSSDEPKILTLIEFASSFKDSCDPELDIENLNEIFTDSIFYTDEQIKIVYELTKTQSESADWFAHRKGRLTSSKFKRIFMKSKKLQENIDMESPNDLIAEIMGYVKQPQTWQMKHGITTESHAKQKYKKLYKLKHKSVKFSEPGMLISNSYPFISVSPDLEVSCSCHGEGLVEIKCPASLIGQKPTVDNYSHVHYVDGEIRLKRTSEYFFQVQGQLAVSNKIFCDFFVFTFDGTITHRVLFDRDFWNGVLYNLNWFWRNYIAPELLTEKVKEKVDSFPEEGNLVRVPRKEFFHIDFAHENESLSEQLLSSQKVDIILNS